jgi:hypothetical protein
VEPALLVAADTYRENVAGIVRGVARFAEMAGRTRRSLLACDEPEHVSPVRCMETRRDDHQSELA